MTCKIKYSSPKKENVLKIETVCFFIGTDLARFGITLPMDPLQ